MKIFKIIIIISILYFNIVYPVKADCSGIDKLTKEYAKCIADLAREKGTNVKNAAKEKGKEVKEKVASDENKKKFSKFKAKLKKFKNSKTGSEFMKKE